MARLKAQEKAAKNAKGGCESAFMFDVGLLYDQV